MFRCKMSVRTLVEFVYQSGDLMSVSSSVERANLGSRIHRQLQSKATGDYRSEVFLRMETEIESNLFVIEGRADGILIEEHTVTIEEIKTTAIPYEDITDEHFVHFAQAYCYGYMYMAEHNVQEIIIQLTYYQIETEQIKIFKQQKTFQELASFYQDTLHQYLRWANLSNNIKASSTKTLRALSFPFTAYRAGQRTFAIAVYKTILENDTLFAQAPTGIGKTISTLFPSLKAIGEGKIEKIFYLCAKNVTANVAYDTLNLLYEQNAQFKTVAITAKDKICFLDERNCDPNVCPYAKGYYDRNKDALYEILNNEIFINHKSVQQVAQKHSICPFELSLDASLYADVIVCDYNYVFDPRVYLKRFFMEKGNYAFLVDEAHNLVDRAREMYSADLRKSSFLEVKRLLPKDRKVLLKTIQDVNLALLSLRKHCEDEQTAFLAQKEPITSLSDKITNFIEQMDVYLQSVHDNQHDDKIKELYFQAINYHKIADLYDDNYITWMVREHNDLYLKQFCMNPHNQIHTMINKGTAAIFFSATLSPIEYFLSLLGGSDETKRLSLPSPFTNKQLKFIINDKISTKYHRRKASIQPIISFIYTAITAKEGNYIVFCPSYAYMNQIAQAFQQAYPAVRMSIQTGDMKENEKQAFLNYFEETGKQHVLFCVMGGMFSEGIDLKGEKLLGTILIGVGLPQINPQQDLIKNHFDELNHMGYAYAYQFPGMNKVLQAAGRVIRSASDKGIIIFIDERFTNQLYKNLLPPHMQHFEVLHDEKHLQDTLHTFWKTDM